MEKKPKFKCLFCDGAASMEAYSKTGTLDEIQLALMCAKLCTKHAQELDDLNTRKEIEQTVA